MLRKTKNFLKANGVYYEKEHVKTMNNRFIVEYTYTWTGRIKINKISLRLHGQQHPREFRNEAQLLQYLKKHSKRYVKGKEISNKKSSKY